MKLGLATVNSGKSAKRTPHSLPILLAPWQSELLRLGPVIVDGPASPGLRLVPGQIGRVGIGTTRTQLRSEKEQARRRLLYELPLPTTSPTCLPKTQIPITPKHTFQVSGTY